MVDKFDRDSLEFLENLKESNNNFIFDTGLFIAYKYTNGPLNIFGAFNFYEEYDIRENDRFRIERFKNLSSSLNIPFFNVKLKEVNNKLVSVLDMNDCNKIACKKLLYFQTLFDNSKYIDIISYNNYAFSFEGWLRFLAFLGNNNFDDTQFCDEININHDLCSYMLSSIIKFTKCYFTDIDFILYSSKICSKGSKVTFVEFKSNRYQEGINYAKCALLQMLYDNVKSQLGVYEELVRLSKSVFEVNFLEVFYVKTSGFYYLIGPKSINCNYNIQSKYQEDFINVLVSRNKNIIKECKDIYKANKNEINKNETNNQINNQTNNQTNQNKSNLNKPNQNKTNDIYSKTMDDFKKLLNKYITDIEISQMFDFSRCSQYKLDELFLSLTNNHINNILIDCNSVKHKMYNKFGLQLKLVSTKGEKYTFNDYLKKWERL